MKSQNSVTMAVMGVENTLLLLPLLIYTYTVLRSEPILLNQPKALVQAAQWLSTGLATFMLSYEAQLATLTHAILGLHPVAHTLLLTFYPTEGRRLS